MPSALGNERVDTKTPRKGFRADIEGLRAFAVILVVLDHLFRWPTGGFIGVDVFYVLSGFLITGILLREHASSGWISFSAFYARRVKRILPAAVTVLVVTVVASYLLLQRARADQILVDAFSALTFTANWHFIRTGTDYLQADGPVSPVQHYWSLSVEEQFYVVWPALMLLLLALAARWLTTRRTPMILAVIAAVTVLSLAWSVWSTAQNPTEAYFDTFGRVWELSAGALLAIALPFLRSMTPRLGTVLSWFGLIALVAGALLITTSTPFPGPWALVPVLATILIIIGGTGTPGIIALTNRPTRYIGRISYSLYLWHFPVIIFTEALLPTAPVAAVVVSLVAMFVLSALSYHLVERPVMASSWLRHRLGAPVRRRRQLVGAAVVALVVVGLSAAQVKGPAVVADGPRLRAALHLDQTGAVSHDAWNSAAELAADVHTAASATEWPTLSPALGDIGTGLAAPQMDEQSGCRNEVQARGKPSVCTSGPADADRVVLVLGDSIAVSWLPGIQAAADADTRVVGLGYASCPLIDALLDDGGSASWTTACAAANQQMLDYAAELQPDEIIVSSSGSAMNRLASGASGDDAGREWEAATLSTARTLDRLAPAVTFLTNTPAGADPIECITAVASPQACTVTISDSWRMKATAERQAVESLPSDAGVRFVDSSAWVCDDDGTCPLFVGTTPVRFDYFHLTAQFSGALGPVLREAFRWDAVPATP
ncbi:acyltransferase family protein [Plantibacter sp. ME-Dv--P-095]|uniref:acyltransferase family protein n=1 Tax=Plantibacter sp. ME-Dv--P-095 TaxID=3040299 RepID=UPI00254D1B5D|nr:acyltransferase family protein [Plantibacter sp. ME-Dv--P-095]